MKSTSCIFIFLHNTLLYKESEFKQKVSVFNGYKKYATDFVKKFFTALNRFDNLLLKSGGPLYCKSFKH